MDDSHPRTGKRCENEYRFKNSTNLCHRREQGSPIASHNSRSYARTGKRCKPTYRQNKSKKLCVSKLVSPSPVSYESYERLGKRCKKSYRHHRPSGLCVYTKKRKQKPRVTREAPLQFDQQDDLVKSPSDNSVLYPPVSPNPLETTMDSPVENNSVLYSPVSPNPLETTMDSPIENNSAMYSPESDNSLLYSPESFKKDSGSQYVNNSQDY